MNKTLCFKLAKQPSQTELRAEKGGFERSYIDISQAKNVIFCRRAAVEGDMSSILLGYRKERMYICIRIVIFVLLRGENARVRIINNFEFDLTLCGFFDIYSV